MLFLFSEVSQRSVILNQETDWVIWFPVECRKTKTKVITPANHNKHKLPNEPIRT